MAYGLYLFVSQIKCEVKAKYTTMKKNPWSEPMSPLRPFFAGITVKKRFFLIFTNENVWVYLNVSRTVSYSVTMPSLATITGRAVLVIEGRLCQNNKVHQRIACSKKEFINLPSPRTDFEGEGILVRETKGFTRCSHFRSNRCSFSSS